MTFDEVLIGKTKYHKQHILTLKPNKILGDALILTRHMSFKHITFLSSI